MSCEGALRRQADQHLDIDERSRRFGSQGSGCGDQCQHPVHVIGIDTE